MTDSHYSTARNLTENKKKQQNKTGEKLTKATLLLRESAAIAS